MRIRTNVRVAQLLLVAIVLTPATAFAWGASGHRMISEIAAQSFPEEIPTFLRTAGAAQTIGELGRELDRSKSYGNPHDAERDPGHYVDLSDDGRVMTGPLLTAIPPTRQAYDTELRKAHTTQYEAGYLPYAIMDGWQQLVTDFAYWRADVAGAKFAKDGLEAAWFDRDRALREMLTIRDIGVWSHYIGDGSQPLHVSVHFNGWGNYPNPNGYTMAKIHAYFEGEFVRRYITEADIVAKLPAPVDLGSDIRASTIAYLAAIDAQVAPLYEIEKAGGFKTGTPQGKDFVAARLAAAVAEIRDLVVAAWRASATAKVGYPPVLVPKVEAGEVDPLDALKAAD
jgi:hypothetical protein